MNFGTSNQFEYIDGQLRPAHAALFKHLALANHQAVKQGQPSLDISYGPHPRQTLDLYRAQGDRRGTVAYFHAGYWQSRDKSGFRFLAPALAADGFNVAVVNYPLSPEMSVGDIVTASCAALPVLAELTGNGPLILIGHSAGAQIAIELGMLARNADWTVSGILAISGVFDLVPLIETSVNEKLGLDLASARAASPLHRAESGAPPAVFAVGALETQAFREQTAAMAQAWREIGNSAALVTVPEADHFSILNELCRDAGLLRMAVSELAGSQ